MTHRTLDRIAAGLGFLFAAATLAILAARISAVEARADLLESLASEALGPAVSILTPTPTPEPEGAGQVAGPVALPGVGIWRRVR